MDRDVARSWWDVIYRVADELEKAGISYSFDASTSLFVHGIEFDMGDVDVTVEWNCLADAHTVFLKGVSKNNFHARIGYDMMAPWHFREKKRWKTSR